MNTSAPLFEDNRFEKEMKQQEAELYSRLYPMAAEDFVAHPDLQRFTQDTIACINALQKQLTTLFKIISSHTHIIPPHTHPIQPHTHNCSAPGQLSGPNIGAFTTMPMQLVTETPTESGSIIWNSVPQPVFQNSTGATPNMEGNMVTVGPSKVGPLIVGKRRLKDDPAIHNNTVLPIVKGLTKL